MFDPTMLYVVVIAVLAITVVAQTAFAFKARHNHNDALAIVYSDLEAAQTKNADERAKHKAFVIDTAKLTLKMIDDFTVNAKKAVDQSYQEGGRSAIAFTTRALMPFVPADRRADVLRSVREGDSAGSPRDPWAEIFGDGFTMRTGDGSGRASSDPFAAFAEILGQRNRHSHARNTGKAAELAEGFGGLHNAKLRGARFVSPGLESFTWSPGDPVPEDAPAEVRDLLNGLSNRGPNLGIEDILDVIAGTAADHMTGGPRVRSFDFDDEHSGGTAGNGSGTTHTQAEPAHDDQAGSNESFSAAPRRKSSQRQQAAQKD